MSFIILWNKGQKFPILGSNMKHHICMIGIINTKVLFIVFAMVNCCYHDVAHLSSIFSNLFQIC